MKNLSIYLLNPEEIFTLLKRLIVILRATLSNDSFIGRVLPSLEILETKLSGIVGRILNNEFTKKLAESDDARDQAFIGFRDYCKACLNHNDSVIQEAAAKLVSLLERYGWTLYNEGYTVQSGKLNSLIEELSEADYQAAITTINGGIWFDTIRNAQSAFEAINKLKEEKEAEKNVPAIAEVRKETVKYLQPVLSYIELLAELDSEAYSEVEKELTEIINGMMAIARARQTRKANETVE
jgi:hypothetical protein